MTDYVKLFFTIGEIFPKCNFKLWFWTKTFVPLSFQKCRPTLLKKQHCIRIFSIVTAYKTYTTLFRKRTSMTCCALHHYQRITWFRPTLDCSDSTYPFLFWVIKMGIKILREKRSMARNKRKKKCNAEGDRKRWLAFLWFVLVLAQFQLALRPTVPLRRSLATLNQHDCKNYYPVDKNIPRLCGNVHVQFLGRNKPNFQQRGRNLLQKK